MSKAVKKRKNKKRRQSVLLKILSIIAAVICVVFILIYMKNDSESKINFLSTEPVMGTGMTEYRKVEVNGKEYKYNTDIISMLCLGIDAQDAGMTGQSDALMLILFDRGEKRMKVIGISRDSMVPIRVFDALGSEIGWDTQQLALAYAYGRTKEKGCFLSLEAVSRMLQGIPVIYYSAANISTIPLFHDVVGEITVQVPEIDENYSDMNIIGGELLTLTSANVEEFIRTRDTEQMYSNKGRMQRQKVYIEAYLDRMKTLLEKDFENTLKKLENVYGNVITNVGVNEIPTFAEMILTYEFDPEKDYFIVEGEDREGKYHDELYVDEEALEQLIMQIFYKER